MISQIINHLHILTEHHKHLEGEQADNVHTDIMAITEMLKPIYKKELTEAMKEPEKVNFINEAEAH
jgi:hypothetical protein